MARYAIAPTDASAFRAEAAVLRLRVDAVEWLANGPVVFAVHGTETSLVAFARLWHGFEA